MSRKFYALFLVICLIVLGMYSSYKYGIHHAMTESVVSVYLDGKVTIFLDGDTYIHQAF